MGCPLLRRDSDKKKRAQRLAKALAMLQISRIQFTRYLRIRDFPCETDF